MIATRVTREATRKTSQLTEATAFASTDRRTTSPSPSGVSPKLPTSIAESVHEEERSPGNLTAQSQDAHRQDADISEPVTECKSSDLFRSAWLGRSDWSDAIQRQPREQDLLPTLIATERPGA